MQFTQTQMTISGTSEEVSRFLDVHPIFRQHLSRVDVRASEPSAPPAAPGPLWMDFIKRQKGNLKKFLHVLLESRGKTISSEKIKNLLSMSQLQINALHGTLHMKANGLPGGPEFIVSNRQGKILYYSIRSDVLSYLYGSGAGVSP